MLPRPLRFRNSQRQIKPNTFPTKGFGTALKSPSTSVKKPLEPLHLLEKQTTFALVPSNEEDGTEDLPDPPYPIRDAEHLVPLLLEGLASPVRKRIDADWQE
jgi:hypothetical protein